MSSRARLSEVLTTPVNMYNKELLPEDKTRFTLLGTGTSSGIPTIACQCPTCTSTDQKDKRQRTSLLVESGNTTVLIDTSPDFRRQMLDNNVEQLDAVFYTHSHFDHIGGFDDLRAFNYKTRKPVEIYTDDETHEKLRRTFFYAFEPPEQIGGGVPMVNVNILDGGPLAIGNLEIVPIPLLHGVLNVYGFRIGNFAYCTDTNHIPESSKVLLEGVEVLVLDALRYHKHPTHFSIEEAINAANEFNPRITYLTHIAHQVKHSDAETLLPDNIRLAYDGLQIII